MIKAWKTIIGHICLGRFNIGFSVRALIRVGVVQKEQWIKSQKTLRSDPGWPVMSWL